MRCPTWSSRVTQIEALELAAPGLRSKRLLLPGILARGPCILPECKWVSPNGLLGFVVLQCPSGVVVPFPQSAGRGGAGDQSSSGCSGAKMAARRGRRDGVAPSPTGGPGPDPGGGVRGSGWGSRNQAPYGTVGTVSCGEQVRGWRAAGSWQQSGVCRAVTRGRHRKGRKHLGVDAGWPPESGQARPGRGNLSDLLGVRRQR